MVHRQHCFCSTDRPLEHHSTFFTIQVPYLPPLPHSKTLRWLSGYNLQTHPIHVPRRIPSGSDCNPVVISMNDHDVVFTERLEALLTLRLKSWMPRYPQFLTGDNGWCRRQFSRSANRFYRAAWNADAVLRWDFCLSVCLSVHLSNTCIVTKRKKNLPRFLYHAKDHLV